MSSRSNLAAAPAGRSEAPATAETMAEVVAERDRLVAECRRLADDAAVARATSDARDRFLAILSHELRAPLSRIVLTLDMIERGLVPPEGLGEALASVRRHVGTQVRTIEDLLDASRAVRGKLRIRCEAVDVHAVLDDVVAAARKEAARLGVSITRALHARHRVIEGDEARVRRVASELVKNALAHTPRGGRVRVVTRDAREALVVEVCDTGHGFAPEAADRLFRAFEPLEPPARGGARGLGFGLALCRGIVLAHGGRIAGSSPGCGRGATFTVELPRLRQPPRD